MPSTHDPLALVKAMGHQHDPYQWAQDFAKSSDQKDALMKELANKMDIAEFNKEAQMEIAKERSKSAFALQDYLLKTRHKNKLEQDQTKFDRAQAIGAHAAVQNARAQGYEPITVDINRLQTGYGSPEQLAAMRSDRLKLIHPGGSGKDLYIIEDPKKPFKHLNIQLPKVAPDEPTYVQPSSNSGAIDGDPWDHPGAL